MNKLSRVGVDLAKNVFQLHGVDRHGEKTWCRRLTRDKWLRVLLDKIEPGCVIGMEACTLRRRSQRHRMYWSYLKSRSWFELPYAVSTRHASV